MSDEEVTIDQSIDLQVDTAIEVSLTEIDDPQEDIVTIEQPSLSALALF
ncbi:MAG: hypothetical protein ABI175_03930 [Polyangiales bacterium]